jgi:hypothetical protein
VTVTAPSGKSVVAGTVRPAEDADEDVDEFVPDPPDERTTDTFSATVDEETSTSMEFEAGGASRTSAAWATVGRGGDLELRRAGA